MDINTITDINELKAMAYDQIAAKEQAEGNLRVINGRISQLSQDERAAEISSPPKDGAPQEPGANGSEPIVGEVVEQPAS